MAIPNRFTKVSSGAAVKAASAGDSGRFTRIGDVKASSRFTKVGPAAAVVVGTGDTGDAQAHAMLDESLAREDEFLSNQPEPTAAVETAIVSHLKDREGEVLNSYLDSVGKLTGGVGHLLSKAEQDLYPKGTSIPTDVVDGWLKADMSKALEAAKRQASEVGQESEEFVKALTSVNFQLGAGWNKIHKGTWKLMQEGKFKEAATEAADSKWNTQTPVRVEDFQDALRSL